MSDPIPAAAAARHLIRQQPTASLATLLADGETTWPYASLVLTATDNAGRPILLLSDLAVHAQNLRRSNRLSLLFDGTVGLEQRLTGARVSLLGTAERSEDQALRARFLARHRTAAMYAGFADFAFYLVKPERAHLVAGFGKIDWLGAADLLSPPTPALASAEAEIVAHMNSDHADALRLYAEKILAKPSLPEPWLMSGIDREGCDLMQGAATARLAFENPVEDPADARAALVRLAKQARSPS